MILMHKQKVMYRFIDCNLANTESNSDQSWEQTLLILVYPRGVVLLNCKTPN